MEKSLAFFGELCIKYMPGAVYNLIDEEDFNVKLSFLKLYFYDKYCSYSDFDFFIRFILELEQQYEDASDFHQELTTTLQHFIDTKSYSQLKTISDDYIKFSELSVKFYSKRKAFEELRTDPNFVQGIFYKSVMDEGGFCKHCNGDYYAKSCRCRG